MLRVNLVGEGWGESIARRLNLESMRPRCRP